MHRKNLFIYYNCKFNRRETSLNQLFDEKRLQITNKLNEEYSEKLKILEAEKDEIIFDEK